MEKTTTITRVAERQAIARPVAGVSATTRSVIIGANVLFSMSLVAAGAVGMLTANRGVGVEHPWSALLWILGLVSLFLIPLEICVIKRRSAAA
ncbi:MAG: hypothetical protein HY673_11730 [Chloroflexi bacterium]|nr:hypothetical protein [Chloroflexota bacterium]